MDIFIQNGVVQNPPFSVEEEVIDVNASGAEFSSATFVSSPNSAKRLVVAAHYIDASNNGVKIGNGNPFYEVEIHPVGGSIVVYALVSVGLDQDTFLDGSSSYTITQGTRFRHVAGKWSRVS